MAAEGSPLALAAEFIGTLMLTLISCGSTSGNLSDSWGPTVVGCTYVALIYSFRGISGGHLNPAVSLTFALVKKFPWSATLAYIVSQALGGLVGGIVYAMLQQSQAEAVAHDDLSWRKSLLVELLYTAVLAFTALSVTSLQKVHVSQCYAVAAGLILVAASHTAGTVPGAALNPATSLGAGLSSLQADAALQGFLDVHYQFLGSALAVLVFEVARVGDFLSLESSGGSRDRVPTVTSLIGEFVAYFLVVLSMGVA